MAFVQRIYNEIFGLPCAELLRRCEAIAEAGFTEKNRDAFDTSMRRVGELQHSAGADPFTEIVRVEAPALPDAAENALNSSAADASVGGNPGQTNRRSYSPTNAPYTATIEASPAPVNEQSGVIARSRFQIPSGLTGERRQTAQQTIEAAGRGWWQSPPGVVSSGTSYQTPESLLRALPSMPIGFLAGIREQLNRFEDAGFQADEVRAADEERARRLAEALSQQTEEERVEVEQHLREVEEAVARNNTTESRLDRIEQLLERIARERAS